MISGDSEVVTAGGLPAIKEVSCDEVREVSNFEDILSPPVPVPAPRGVVVEGSIIEAKSQRRGADFEIFSISSEANRWIRELCSSFPAAHFAERLLRRVVVGSTLVQHSTIVRNAELTHHG